MKKNLCMNCFYFLLLVGDEEKRKKLVDRGRKDAAVVDRGIREAQVVARRRRSSGGGSTKGEKLQWRNEDIKKLRR